MYKNDFKSLFNKIALKNQFIKAYNGWYKANDNIIIILDLQKSNYSELYYMNIKIYIQMIWGSRYIINKHLIKNDTGDIFERQPEKFYDIFDLESSLNDEERTEKLNELFENFLSQFVHKALSLNGIIELEREKMIYITPAVKERILEMIDIKT